MDAPQKNAKQIGPAAAIFCGIVCFALASIILCSGISGLVSGRTHTLGKGVHYLIVKQDTPGEFWAWIILRFICAATSYTGAVIIFLSGFRKIRR